MHSIKMNFDVENKIVNKKCFKLFVNENLFATGVCKIKAGSDVSCIK